MTDHTSSDRVAFAASHVQPGSHRSRSVLERKLVFVLMWVAPCAYYLALLTDGHFDVLRHVDLGLTFNDMLGHLLRGRFDVDPDAIRYEGFVRDGRTYSYFGVFCALLRLPLLVFSRLRDTDVTIASMFVALCVSWLSRLMALRTVLFRAPVEPISVSLVVVLFLGFALEGEGVQFLQPSIYQEVVSWSDALASVFVFLTIEMVTRTGATDRLMSSGFAVIAGFALLARVSTGLGLYAATAFMLLLELVRTGSAGRPDWWRRIAGFTVSCRYVPIVALLTFFIVCTAVINYGRWGNPLTFADFHAYSSSTTEYLDRIPRLEKYGEFNFARLIWGLQYYFLPLWILPGQDGVLLFQDTLRELIEVTELPPGTFLLSDPLLIVLGTVFAARAMWAWRAAIVDVPMACAALLGLAVPAILMLIALYMSFRYRMEFYPFLDTAALLGLFVLLRTGMARSRRLTPILAAAAIVGIVCAHVSLMLYKIAPLGPVTKLDLTHGWGPVFMRSMGEFYPSIARLVTGVAQ